MIPASNLSNLNLGTVHQIEYISMTWDDLNAVVLIAGAICMLAGYAINELHHRHKAKKGA